MPVIAPSILNADFSRLHEEIQMLNESEAEWIHLDIMDGIFVPNISFGIPIVEAVRKLSDKFLDVHLMIQKPDKYVEAFYKAGANNIIVHYEADHNLEETLKKIKSFGIDSSVCINPKTPVEVLYPYLKWVDMVLIMSVEAGFGGQAFMPETYQRVETLKKHLTENNLKVRIEVDGGVNYTNAGSLAEKGVDVLVAGSLVFKSDNPKETIKKLKDIAFQHAV